MNKKLLVLLMCLVFAVATAAGCTLEEPKQDSSSEQVVDEKTEEVEEAKDELLIGVVLGDLGNSIHRQIGTTMTEKAEEMGGKVILKESGGDAAKLVEVIENFIVAGCDVIVQQNTDQEITRAVNQQAVDAGIYIISFDAEMDLAEVSFVADNYELGYKTGVMAGEWVNENLGGEAEFGLLTASAYDFILVRQKGIEDGLAATAPNAKIVIEDDAISVIDGTTATDIFLQAYPDLNGIIGITDGNILGAYESFKSAGKLGDDIGLFSCDLSDAGADAIREGSIFRGAIFLSPTFTAIEMTEDSFLVASGGTPTEAVKYFPMEPVSVENIDDVIK